MTAAMAKERNAVDSGSANRKRRRYRPGTIALREIKKQQNRTNLLIKKLPFERTLREIMRDYKDLLRISGDGTLDAFQEMTEALIIKSLEDAQLCSIHAGRVTVKKDDMILARKILQRNNYRS